MGVKLDGALAGDHVVDPDEAPALLLKRGPACLDFLGQARSVGIAGAKDNLHPMVDVVAGPQKVVNALLAAHAPQEKHVGSRGVNPIVTQTCRRGNGPIDLRRDPVGDRPNSVVSHLKAR